MICTFDELNIQTLYRILKARVDIFVVEQACPYPELDDLDQKCLHVWQEKDGNILAYCRILPEGLVYPDAPAIGRVLSVERGIGAGRAVIQEAIQFIEKEWKPQAIQLAAQVYAQKFYEKEGFQVCSAPFTEDGIPHVQMKRLCKRDIPFC